MTRNEARSPRCRVPGAMGGHPTLRTPHVVTYRRVVERLARCGVETASLDAACLIEAASGIPRWQFIVDPERPVESGATDLLESMLARREAREPLAYILGTKEFWSLPLAVGPGVLVPRPETESLVDAVLESISSKSHAPRVELGTRNSELAIVDLGTGCGAIALALAVELSHARIYALDCSPAALGFARRNVEALGLMRRVRLIQGDLFEPFRRMRRGIDLIVSNPPYIPSAALAALPPEILAHEPREALDGGPDGLGYYRRIIEQAPDILREDGWLALEIGDAQSPAVVGLIRAAGAFGAVGVRRDLAGRERVVLARRETGTHG